MKIAHITSLKAAISILESQTFYAPKLILDFGISGIPISKEYSDDLGSYLHNLRGQQLEQAREVILLFKWHGKVIEYETATPDISEPEYNAVGVYPFWKVFLPAGFNPAKLEVLAIEPFENLLDKKIEINNEEYFKKLATEQNKGWFTSQKKKELKLLNKINRLIESNPKITVSVLK
ncbi:hypothetical protein SJR90_01075 [Aeromonas caviae]|uniref:hypothetical protein n=1 Tax=Aeromonas TaxID=642 RepID=UPI000A743C8A|nr:MULTISPECIES: hypothetical protein [Aeromonas]MDX7780959.1 hypothetical protein [Aeromonas caviae]MDY7766719.1 hypothetical protein [Aeromonas caviae]